MFYILYIIYISCILLEYIYIYIYIYILYPDLNFSRVPQVTREDKVYLHNSQKSLHSTIANLLLYIF